MLGIMICFLRTTDTVRRKTPKAWLMSGLGVPAKPHKTHRNICPWVPHGPDSCLQTQVRHAFWITLHTLDLLFSGCSQTRSMLAEIRPFMGTAVSAGALCSADDKGASRRGLWTQNLHQQGLQVLTWGHYGWQGIFILCPSHCLSRHWALGKNQSLFIHLTLA